MEVEVPADASLRPADVTVAVRTTFGIHKPARAIARVANFVNLLPLPAALSSSAKICAKNVGLGCRVFPDDIQRCCFYSVVIFDVRLPSHLV